MRKKKFGWGMVIGVLLLVASCVAAYNITKLPEKNVGLPEVRTHLA